MVYFEERSPNLELYPTKNVFSSHVSPARPHEIDAQLRHYDETCWGTNCDPSQFPWLHKLANYQCSPATLWREHVWKQTLDSSNDTVWAKGWDSTTYPLHNDQWLAERERLFPTHRTDRVGGYANHRAALLQRRQAARRRDAYMAWVRLNS